MKKTFGVQTELVKLNIHEILANYKNPKYWKKKWLVFKHRDFEVNWRMYEIDLEGNKIRSKVVLHYTGKKRHNFWSTYTSYCDSIPIENSDYSQTMFNRNLLAAVLNSITYLEHDLIEHTYEYEQACKLEEEEYERLRQVAEKFLDDNNVKNQDIRDAYIESYLSKTPKFEYKNKIRETAIRKYYPTARLLACSWFDYKKRFDEEKDILNQNSKVTKKIIYSIWRSRKELEGEEYLKKAEEALESL